MKLKQATFLAIIGVGIMLLFTILNGLSMLGLFDMTNRNTGELFWIFKYQIFFFVIGNIFMLIFFITLAKNQK